MIKWLKNLFKKKIRCDVCGLKIRGKHVVTIKELKQNDYSIKIHHNRKYCRKIAQQGYTTSRFEEELTREGLI